jgi:hypothetical protein
MKKTQRPIFPVSDASNDKGKWYFELPRQGWTILVRKRKIGKIVRKFT